MGPKKEGNPGNTPSKQPRSFWRDLIEPWVKPKSFARMPSLSDDLTAPPDVTQPFSRRSRVQRPAEWYPSDTAQVISTADRTRGVKEGPDKMKLVIDGSNESQTVKVYALLQDALVRRNKIFCKLVDEESGMREVEVSGEVPDEEGYFGYGLTVEDAMLEVSRRIGEGNKGTRWRSDEIAEVFYEKIPDEKRSSLDMHVGTSKEVMIEADIFGPVVIHVGSAEYPGSSLLSAIDKVPAPEGN